MISGLRCLPAGGDQPNHVACRRPRQINRCHLCASDAFDVDVLRDRTRNPECSSAAAWAREWRHHLLRPDPPAGRPPTLGRPSQMIDAFGLGLPFGGIDRQDLSAGGAFEPLVPAILRQKSEAAGTATSAEKLHQTLPSQNVSRARARSCLTGGSLLIRVSYPAALLPPRSRHERAQVLIRASD